MSKTSFMIILKSNDKASWCGEIHWIEGRKKENFRSSLEMLMLMNSVVNTHEFKDEKEIIKSAISNNSDG